MGKQTVQHELLRNPKYTSSLAIEESKDTSSLALDELIGNLKVHDVFMEKDSEIYRGKQPREENKSFRQRDDKKGKSDRKCFRCSDPNHLIGDCTKPPRNKDQKAFIRGSWSDSENDFEDKTNDETCLMAQSSNEVTLNSSYYSDNASYLDNESSIVAIRTAHGREFDNEVQFRAYCDAQGITHNFLAPRTPQSNGIVERKNRTLQEMSMTMLNEQSIPQKFWCNVVDTSTYILNRILIRPILGKTPYEIFRGRKPSLEYFKVFGSKCFILNTKDYLTKFNPKSYEGVFLGYSQNSKAFVVLNKHTLKVKESLNVTFDESLPPTKLSPLVDDDVGEEGAIENNTKVVNNSNKEDESIEVDEVVKESKNHPLEQVTGLQIKQMEDVIFSNQSKYIKEMLKKFGLEDSKPTKTPMSMEIKLTKDDEADSVDSSKYREQSTRFWLSDRNRIETVSVMPTPDHGAIYVESRKGTSGIVTFHEMLFNTLLVLRNKRPLAICLGIKELLQVYTAGKTYASHIVDLDLPEESLRTTDKHPTSDLYKMSQPANDEFSQHLSDEESNHEDASDTGAAPKQQQQSFFYWGYLNNATQNIQTPILKKEEKDGIVQVLSPVTAAEIQAVEKERKAKNILLMAIPKEHMRRFHGMDDVKEI
ncbi:retrovirus-related pol polyprotein from transposon TNT 1-94 [Tanacetum coccineum]